MNAVVALAGIVLADASAAGRVVAAEVSPARMTARTNHYAISDPLVAL